MGGHSPTRIDGPSATPTTTPTPSARPCEQDEGKPADAPPSPPGPMPTDGSPLRDSAGRTWLDDHTYIDPTTRKAVYVPRPIPRFDPADRQAIVAGQQQMMAVRPESLDDFASKVSAAHQVTFAGGAAAAPPRFDAETNIPPHHLGTFAEASTLASLYAPLQSQVGGLLTELEQLVAELHAKVRRSGDQYQATETATAADMRSQQDGLY